MLSRNFLCSVLLNNLLISLLYCTSYNFLANKIEQKSIEKAFQIEYKGTTLDTFYLRLKQFHDSWLIQVRPYTPYLTIIQSSGSGKTRLVVNPQF